MPRAAQARKNHRMPLSLARSVLDGIACAFVRASSPTMSAMVLPPTGLSFQREVLLVSLWASLAEAMARKAAALRGCGS